MDKIHAMRLFVRVAELASFSRAADTLGLAKGSVSRQIQALEDQVGTRLLQRTTRRVQLTPDGTIYFERCRDLLASVDELDNLFHHDPATVSGRLRVDMPLGVARHIVMPRLPEFMAQYPGIALELGSSDRRVDLIQEGYDCVVRVGTLTSSGLVARPLGKLTQINCASPGYLKRFGHPRELADLSHHATVHYQNDFGAAAQGFEYREGGERCWIKTGGMLTVNSTESYRTAACAGLGIIQAPRIGLEEALRRRELVEILPHYRAAPLPVSLLYPPRRNLSRRVYVFMEWLEQIARHYVD